MKVNKLIRKSKKHNSESFSCFLCFS